MLRMPNVHVIPSNGEWAVAVDGHGEPRVYSD